ncbi:hypothetical protein [Gracilimonas sp.]|uniref:hypothetical protein n=1 Tax=Gracilimonas sp. TaxID=1974203 RepID=UPI003BAB0991
MRANKVFIKVMLIITYVLFHLYLLRPIRTAVFQYQVDDELIESVQSSQYLSFQKLDTRLAVFKYSTGNAEKLFFYKISFGHFFFLGIIGLILFGAENKFYVVLIAAHGFILISATLIFWMDPIQHTWMFHVLDFLSTYLAPLSALGVIPLALFFNSRNKASATKGFLAKG